MYASHSENWHQLQQSGPGMEHTKNIQQCKINHKRIHAWNVMMKTSHSTCRKMHLELDWELLCCKPKAIQAVPEMKYQTTPYSDPVHLLAKAWPAQKKIQQHRVRNTWHIIQTQEISPLLLCKRGEYHYTPQAASCNVQKRHHNTVTKTAMESTVNTSIQSQSFKSLHQTHL